MTDMTCMTNMTPASNVPFDSGRHMTCMTNMTSLTHMNSLP
jgi:hypothetical protein